MKKIAVLGLGKSLALYTGAEDFAIGVNDIWRAVQADYVVCVDRPDRFTPERLAVIKDCTPLRFYSQLPDWAGRPDYQRIELQPDYPNYTCQLHIPAIPKSLCSPFVAAAIAYKLHAATEIHLYGVDLIDHPLLDARSCGRIRLHFTQLKIALAMAGSKLITHGDGLLRSL
jgi:hypothetical protein